MKENEGLNECEKSLINNSKNDKACAGHTLTEFLKATKMHYNENEPYRMINDCCSRRQIHSNSKKE